MAKSASRRNFGLASRSARSTCPLSIPWWKWVDRSFCCDRSRMFLMRFRPPGVERDRLATGRRVMTVGRQLPYRGNRDPPPPRRLVLGHEDGSVLVDALQTRAVVGATVFVARKRVGASTRSAVPAQARFARNRPAGQDFPVSPNSRQECTTGIRRVVIPGSGCCRATS